MSSIDGVRRVSCLVLLLTSTLTLAPLVHARPAPTAEAPAEILIDGLSGETGWYTSLDAKKAAAHHPRRLQQCLLTRQDVLGPYFLEGAPRRNKNFCPPATHSNSSAYRNLTLTINLHNGCTGARLENATGEVQVWQADNTGVYDNNRNRGRGCSTCRCRAAVPVTIWNTTTSAGNATTTTVHQAGFKYMTIIPSFYGSNGCFRPAHIHHTFRVTGFRPLTTQMYFRGTQYMGSADCGCGSACGSGDPGLQTTVSDRGAAVWDVYLMPLAASQV